TGGLLTSISGGLLFAAGQFADMRAKADHMIIDLSGDGPNNAGPSIAEARDFVLGKGITINGLPLAAGEQKLKESAFGLMYDVPTIDLDAYFADCVIGGVDAFTMPITGGSQLFTAIRRKLIREIAARPARIVPAALIVRPSSAADCEAERDIQAR